MLDTCEFLPHRAIPWKTSEGVKLDERFCRSVAGHDRRIGRVGRIKNVQYN